MNGWMNGRDDPAHFLHKRGWLTADAQTHAHAHLGVYVEEIVEATVSAHHDAVHQSRLDAPKLAGELRHRL